MVEDVIAFHAQPVEDVRPPPARAPEDLRREEPRDLRAHRRGAARAAWSQRPSSPSASCAGSSTADRATSSHPRPDQPEAGTRMCGIVGYIGRQDAAPVAPRGADPARAPRLRLGRASPCSAAAGSRSPSRPAGCATSPTCCPSGSPARSASATPAGPPTARPPTPTPTRTPTSPADVAVVHNGIIDNAAALRPSSIDAGVDAGQRHRHRGARPPGRAAATPTPSRARSRDALAAVVRHLRPRRRCTPTSRTGSWSPATAARWSSASATRRCTSPPTSPRSCATPRPSRCSTTARWRP